MNINVYSIHSYWRDLEVYLYLTACPAFLIKVLMFTMLAEVVSWAIHSTFTMYQALCQVLDIEQSLFRFLLVQNCILEKETDIYQTHKWKARQLQIVTNALRKRNWDGTERKWERDAWRKTTRKLLFMEETVESSSERWE